MAKKNIDSIYLVGDVDGNMVEKVATMLDEYSERNTTLSDLIVGFHSPGGDPASGYAIIDMLYLIAGDATIHTVNLGDTSSAAFDIYMVGDKRYGTRQCEFTIHRTYKETDKGERLRIEDFQEAVKELKKDDQILFNETLSDTKLTKTMRTKLLQGKDVVLAQKQARRYNIINTGGLPWEHLKR